VRGQQYILYLRYSRLASNHCVRDGYTLNIEYIPLDGHICTAYQKGAPLSNTELAIEFNPLNTKRNLFHLKTQFILAQSLHLGYNVTLSCVRVTIVAAEKRLVLHCVCVCVCVRARVALVIHHVNRVFSVPHCIVTCGLSACTVFCHVIS
jgi:hypothetical protein